MDASFVERRLVLLEAGDSLQQTGTLNWSSDAEVIRRIVKLLQKKDESEDQSLRHFVDALNRYADNLEGGISSQNTVDLSRAREVLRVRNLAQIMRDQQDILASYFETLKSSPEVRKLIDNRISELAEQHVQFEKTGLSSAMTAQLQADLANLRVEREAELKKSIDELSNEMTADLEARASARRAERDLQIAELERQGIESLEQSLGRRKSDLTEAVAALEGQKESALTELSNIEQAKNDAQSSLSDLKAKENQAIETVERVTGLAAKAELIGRSMSGAIAALPESDIDIPAAAKVRLDGFKDAVSEYPLLTPKGKSTLLRFAILLAAREVPLLCGPECDDFLVVAETLLFGGRRSALESDPTIVCFDDLWMRPGTRTATPLRGAVLRAIEDASRPQFCVIFWADQSGARFWYPALADRMHRGEIPKAVSVCATLTDRESEEAKCFARGAIVLELSGIIVPKAGAIAPGLLSGSKAKRFEIETGRDRTDDDPKIAVEFLAMLSVTLGVADSARVGRILTVAKQATDTIDAEAIAREAAALIAGTPTTSAPNLNVIAGGASRV